MMGRSGPCKRCGSTITVTNDLLVSDALGRREGPGRRRGGYRPALPEAVPLETLFRPPVAVVFVPTALVIGFVIWLSARAHSEHFEATGQTVMYFWWLLYPLIGYYMSVGWIAAGMGTSRQARYLGTDLALVVSDSFVFISTEFLVLIAGMFKVRRSGIRNLCKLWGMLNAALIRGVSQMFGRLISAALLPVPLVAWALCSRNRPLGTPGNFALHVAGVVPGMIVLGLFLAPLNEHARYEQKFARGQAAGAISGQPSNPQAGGRAAGPGSDLTAGDPSKGIWTGTWDVNWTSNYAKLTVEQRGSAATGDFAVSYGGPFEATVRGNVLSGVWHHRYVRVDTPFEFHMERDGRSFKGWIRHNPQNTSEVSGTRTSPSKPVDDAKGRLEFAAWSGGPMSSLAEAGYRSGATLLLGETLKMDAAEKALRDTYTFVGRSGNALRVEKVGPAEASLWLREDDALLVVATAATMEKRETLLALEVAWQDVLKCLGGAGALSRPVEPVLRWENAAEFFTEKPDQYQRISVLGGFRGGTLSCPPGQPAWAQVMPRRRTDDGGAFWLSLSRGDKSLIDVRNAYFIPLVSFADLPFGDHALGAYVREDALLVLDGFYPAADGRLTLAAGKGSPHLAQQAQ